MPGILFKSNTENTLKKISAWNHVSKSIFFSFSDKEFAALRINHFTNTLGHTLERVRGRFLLSLRKNLGKRDGNPGCKVTKEAQMCQWCRSHCHGFEWCWHIKGHCLPQRGSFLERDKTIWENATEAFDSLVNYADGQLCSAVPEVMNLNMLHPTFKTNGQMTLNRLPSGLDHESNFLGNNFSMWDTHIPIKTIKSKRKILQ